MELNVGDYCRTKSYGIRKISGFLSDIENDYIDCDDEFNRTIINKKEIIKSSPNIIDLIEENDYINGLRVEKNKYGDLYTSYTYMGGLIGRQGETYTTFLKDYEEDYIQSVLTHEQFEAMKYKVGDN